MDETLEDRIAAVERALTDGDHDLSALAAEGSAADRVETVENDLDGLEERVAELEAATQALRGYVGNVRAVNEEVRERADLALETARAAESDNSDTEPTVSPTDENGRSGEQRASGGREGPTLELETDSPRNDSPLGDTSPSDTSPTGTPPADSPTRDQSSDQRCPLCDDDGSASVGHALDRPKRGGTERHHDSRHGLTDGGHVRDDEPTEAGDVGLLASIRTLL